MPQRKNIVTAVVACLILCLTIESSYTQAAVRAGNRWLSNPDLVPLRDFVLIKFDRPLDELRQQYTFGTFRDIDPHEVQWIEETYREVDFPGRDNPFGFLNLHYEVPRNGSYNGWWIKLNNIDRHKFGQWNLVLRLRQGEPCTKRFKIELKLKKKASEQPAISEYIVNVSGRQLDEMEERGFFDVFVPLRTMPGRADPSEMLEFVIVFENQRVSAAKGDLLIHSIRLAPPKDKESNMNLQTFLDQLGRKAFLWFEEHRNKTTGLILDRGANSPARGESSNNLSSIASVGYYLSMLPEAERTGQISRKAAKERALQIVTYALNSMRHYHGLFHHFIKADTGRPSRGSEVSCLDSAIFFNGCIVVAEAYGGRIAELANTLVDRADWRRFIVQHPKTGKDLLAFGWKETKGLLGPMDVRSSELAMPYFLAAGSRSHPIDPQCWYNTAVVSTEVGGRIVLNAKHPLFTSYYGLGWHNLKGLVDKDGIDLDGNARQAALLNRDFCRLSAEHSLTYSEKLGGWWGISAGDSPAGYIAPKLIPGNANGTVWPITALAAVPWIPDEIEADLDKWRKSSLWAIVSGTYGPAPFNLDVEWVGSDLIGIDLGSFYINLANYRNRTVQQLWTRHPVAKLALKKLGYQKSSNSGP